MYTIKLFVRLYGSWNQAMIVVKKVLKYIMAIIDNKKSIIHMTL